MAFLTTTLFILVLWKHSGVRLWPHAYAGEAYQPGRLVYYTETLISLGGMALCVLQIGALKEVFKRHIALTVFVVFAQIVRFLPGSENSSPVLLNLGFVDSMIAVFLMVTICGPEATRNLMVKLALVFIAINLASLGVPRISMMIGSFSGFARGLTAHRNDLAHVSTIAVFFLICGGNSIAPLLKWGGILGGGALVALAGSVQGIFLLAGGFGVLAFSRYSRILKSPFMWLCLFFTGAMAIVFWSTFSLDDLLRPFGRDATFTGRDRIWGLSLYLLDRMPWSGYGIGSVGSEVVTVALLLSFQLGTSFGTAHNSYLEALLSFGWIGGGLFFVALLVGASRVFKSYMNLGASGSALPAMVMFFCLIGGFTSSEKLFWPAFGWLSFVLAIVLNDTSLVLGKSESQGRKAVNS